MTNLVADPKVLMLVPSVAKRNIDTAVQNGDHPTMDYYALQEEMNADLLDYAALEADGNPRLVRIARRAGRDAALAAMAFLRRDDYDVIYSNGENVGIPLALMLKGRHRRPGHVLIGHRVSPRKKRPFLRMLSAQIDAMFLYCTPQWKYAAHELGFDESKLHLIPFHADHRFFHPLPATSDSAPMICSAGLEWRDYPTLIAAVTGLDVEVRLAAASPWSKHRNETRDRKLPPNISARRYDYAELRQLYAESRFVVVPLYQNDFQAGITTILEAMAMGKAVVTSRTTGQIDTIRDGHNGLYVAPEEPMALRAAIVRLLNDPEERKRMGSQARLDIEAGLTLDHWVERLKCVIEDVGRKRTRLHP